MSLSEAGVKPDYSSIFERYYTEEPFQDRFLSEPEDAVDVIIPVIHTNEVWHNNLLSIYREIPVKRLLISDGGCIDNSIEVLKAFPRVVILDHKQYTSLGYCLRKLIEEVTAEWFIYLHSDVFLPDGWFDTMKKHQSEYDWFGCPQQITALIQYKNVDKIGNQLRPYAGSQMGRKTAFVEGMKKIDDDYVYRQEDLVLADIVESAGFRHGRIEDTFHYHQVMHKESTWGRKLTKVSVEVEWDQAEKIRASTSQFKGLIKYLAPSSNLASVAESHIAILLELGEVSWDEIRGWIEDTNPAWIPYIRYWRIRLIRRPNNGLAKLLWKTIHAVAVFRSS